MTNELDLSTLTDEELCEYHKAWENEAKRRIAIRKRQAFMNLREALGEFLKEGVQYDCERVIELEVVNDRYEDDIVAINVFDEEILNNIKDHLDLRVGNYTGE